MRGQQKRIGVGHREFRRHERSALLDRHVEQFPGGAGRARERPGGGDEFRPAAPGRRVEGQFLGERFELLERVGRGRVVAEGGVHDREHREAAARVDLGVGGLDLGQQLRKLVQLFGDSDQFQRRGFQVTAQ
jgi:hypothetical protein